MKKEIFASIMLTILLLNLFSLSSSAFIIKNNTDNEKNRYALLIGYGGKTSIITKNADKMKNLLIKYSWKEENIKTVIGLEATKNKILTSISGWLDEKEETDDDVLIYFSIHGGGTDEDGVYNSIDLDEPDNREEFIQPVDFVLRYPAYPLIPFGCNFDEAILDDELGEMINLLDSKNIAIIFESCYSGGMIDGDLDLAKPGRVIITSSSKNELSWFSKPKMYSYFTHHLMNGFEGEADKDENGGNGDGNVSVKEAFYYSKPRTIEQSKKEKITQTPQIYDGYDSEFNIIDLSKKEKNKEKQIESHRILNMIKNIYKLFANLFY